MNSKIIPKIRKNKANNKPSDNNKKKNSIKSQYSLLRVLPEISQKFSKTFFITPQNPREGVTSIILFFIH